MYGPLQRENDRANRSTCHAGHSRKNKRLRAASTTAKKKQMSIHISIIVLFFFDIKMLFPNSHPVIQRQNKSNLFHDKNVACMLQAHSNAQN